MSVRAAITAVERNEKMSSLLMDCINFTGDVDTVATIALAAGSCSEEIVQDLPENLKLLLENGKYGRDFLTSLAGSPALSRRGASYGKARAKIRIPS
ncbi:hypothetical protein [Okeania sp. SIO2C9]|uniref:hypothetical protein n=1 Tax=Okeania sp. SIO2C9 TaxID=2607791 RepID=UPI0025E1D528|nr:hypothetical protein [Okeania sp. SIO2C9]